MHKLRIAIGRRGWVAIATLTTGAVLLALAAAGRLDLQLIGYSVALPGPWARALAAALGLALLALPIFWRAARSGPVEAAPGAASASPGSRAARGLLAAALLFSLCLPWLRGCSGSVGEFEVSGLEALAWSPLMVFAPPATFLAIGMLGLLVTLLVNLRVFVTGVFPKSRRWLAWPLGAALTGMGIGLIVSGFPVRWGYWSGLIVLALGAVLERLEKKPLESPAVPAGRDPP